MTQIADIELAELAEVINLYYLLDEEDRKIFWMRVITEAFNEINPLAPKASNN